MGSIVQLDIWVCEWCGARIQGLMARRRHANACEKAHRPARKTVDHRPHYNGLKIRKMILRRGYDQKQFAREIGVSQAALSNFVNGKTRSAKMAYKVAEGLGVDIPELQVRARIQKPWPPEVE